MAVVLLFTALLETAVSETAAGTAAGPRGEAMAAAAKARMEQELRVAAAMGASGRA